MPSGENFATTNPEHSDQAGKFLIEILILSIIVGIINWFLFQQGTEMLVFAFFVNFTYAGITIYLLFYRIDILVLSRLNQVNQIGSEDFDGGSGMKNQSVDIDDADRPTSAPSSIQSQVLQREGSSLLGKIEGVANSKNLSYLIVAVAGFFVARLLINSLYKIFEFTDGVIILLFFILWAGMLVGWHQYRTKNVEGNADSI